jgi:hypothetical protein
MDELLEFMALQGYEYQEPGEDAAAIDRAVCSESKCSECGDKGMEYMPFHKGASYRAFAVCPKCGSWEEF